MKSSVEWLLEQYIKYGGISKSMAEQAKQMEKEQIMNAWDEVGFGWANSSEEYYNRTYKNTNDV